MPKVTLPGQTEPLGVDGGLINPTWYEKLKALEKLANYLSGPAAVGQFIVMNSAGNWEYQPSVAPTAGQVLTWDNTNKRWVAAAN